MNMRKRAVIFMLCLIMLSMTVVASAKPPTWAPAHGLRHATYQYVYQYYPSAGVYFDITRNLYFYEVNGEWTQTTTLSADIQQLLKEFVTINMDTQTPYDIHQEIAAVYSSPSTSNIAEAQKLIEVPKQMPAQPPQEIAVVAEARKIVEVPRQTPPAQPTEGQPVTYQYRYYPDADVYRDSSRNLYFYQIDRQWFQAPTLPPDIDQSLTEFVELTMQTENPVEFNREVVQLYPPFQVAFGRTEASASRQYLYYPAVKVYFDPDRELYFYYTNHQWVKAPTLPKTIQSRLTEFVTLSLKTETPYAFQESVDVLYPSSQAVQVIRHNDQPTQPRQHVEQGKKVTYVYYYNRSVYFDPARALYFYMRNGTWQHASTLPCSITINLGQSVNVELNTLIPYVYHQTILKQHPSQHDKKNGKPQKVKEHKPKKDKKH